MFPIAVRDYIHFRPSKVLNSRTSLLEEPQQLRPLGWESDVRSDTATNGIKEEAASWEGGNQSDCSVNPCTEQIQGTDTPAPIMGCSLNNSSAEDYKSVVIKEEASSWEEEKPLAEGTQGTDTATLMGRSLNSSGFPKDTAHGTEEESDSWETDHNYCNINTEQPLGTDQSAPTMGCSLSTNSPADYLSFVIIEEVASWEGESQSYYRIHPLTEQIQGTDTPTPIMGCSLNNSSAANYLLNNIKEGVGLWEGGNQSQIRMMTTPGTDQATPGGGYTLYNSHTDISDYGEGETANDSSKTKGKLRCAVCNKLFISKRTLERHQIVHTGEKPYSCPDCGKSFARLSTLTVHRRTHTGEKPFTCAECGKRFASVQHMASHRIVHTGEKPFSCPDCGRSFAHRSTYNKHLPIHTGEKPHACADCGRCFSCLELLRLHLKTHREEKRFTCSDCGIGFADRSWFHKHLRTHTGRANVLPT
ncbi:oocyte zinc finger protein XlCOF7.1-like [Xenopus tropicalis]|uniref:Oocyte zinc finger protein XlCOF7.1-like n=1 Tax=Xenopus tropicalis TaxID=8364 RepID=A0A8J1IUB8_XENTR|nr:oocyte zinc finger protein XlCOF7.1-like [Xenopus tropicalis]